MSNVTPPPIASPARPGLAIVSNSQTPYRLHLHKRIAAEMPGVKLWSLYTHETSDSDWAFDAPAEIGPVRFGQGETVAQQGDPRNALREWRRAGRIIRWLVEHDVRVVVMMGYNDAGRLRIIRWCRRRGLPCFLFGDSNIHGDRATGVKRLVKTAVVRWVVRQCAGILPCGSLGRAYFAKYGATEGRMFNFPYEPDYDLVRQLPAEAIAAARARFSLPVDRRRIVYSGRLAAVKRVDLLVDAFTAIADERPNWDLVIVGDGSLRSELAARVPERLASRVIWAGFQNDQAIVAAVYRASDVLVLPSDHEPWALVVNEAAAAGLAIVCSNVVGAAAELVRDGVNGYLFPPGDVAALTRCLRDVTDPVNTDQLKAASADVLADWRRRGDPVVGLGQAMRSVGVDPGATGH